MKRKVLFLALLILLAGLIQIHAQLPAPENQLYSPAQLDQMLGPIALYPDPLIAQILPAATQPSQIALAYSYVSQGGDPNQAAAQPWDSSVKALAYYPDVLQMMNNNLPWTTELGQAFLNQPTDVMNSVQRLRVQAQELGNLQSTSQQQVIQGDGVIEIVPTDPDLIYVPTYDPGIIFFQRPFGRHFLSFGRGFRTGLWLDHDFDWHSHDVIVWDRDHPRPTNWWRTPPDRRPRDSHAGVWHAPSRPAAPVTRGGDRGYEPTRVAARPEAPAREPAPRPAPPAREPAPRPQPPVTEPAPRPAPPVREPAPRPAPPVRETRPAPVAPPRQPAPAPRSAPSAFSGVNSASSTREASTRGAQSRQVAPRPSSPPPAPRPAPPPSGGGAPDRRH